MTEAHNTTTGQDSEPAAQQLLTEQQLLDGDYETTAEIGVAKLQPVKRENIPTWPVDGPVLENAQPEDLKAIAARYGELRRAAGGGEPNPIQFNAPQGGEYKDAKDAVEQSTVAKQARIYEQERAKGVHPDEALAATKQYLTTELPKVVTDDRNDTFATPRAAAERLQELRRVEAEEALKARAAAAMFEVKDANVGKSTAQLEQEFRAAAPAWVIDTETRELWKAQLKSAGDLVAVQAIEAFEESYQEAERREQAEQAVTAAAQQQPPQPEPTPQPQPQLPPTPQVEQLRFSEANAVQLLNNAVAQFQQKYFNLAQVNDPNILARAREEAAALVAGKSIVDGISAQRQLAETQAAQTRAANYNAWAMQQDALFENSLSEAERAMLPAVTNAAQAYLRERGFDDAEQRRRYYETGELRDWRAQRSLFDAIAAKVSRDGIEAKKQRPQAPPVQRPGTRGETPTVDEARVAALSRALDSPNTSQRDQLRIAAQLLAAQRGRGRSSGPGWM